jgi:hypothetical protein
MKKCHGGDKDTQGCTSVNKEHNISGSSSSSSSTGNSDKIVVVIAAAVTIVVPVTVIK